MKDLSQIPTAVLQEKYNEERDRIMEKLIRQGILSHETKEMLLHELKMMFEELERRKISE